MSTSPNDGGPAFPIVSDDLCAPGMTLRDYFAAAALQGLLASSKDIIGMSEANYATAAYLQADAMLAERNKGA
jgi:hypothetical protein